MRVDIASLLPIHVSVGFRMSASGPRERPRLATYESTTSLFPASQLGMHTPILDNQFLLLRVNDR